MEPTPESTAKREAVRLLKEQQVRLPRRQQTAVTNYLAAHAHDAERNNKASMFSGR